MAHAPVMARGQKGLQHSRLQRPSLCGSPVALPRHNLHAKPSLQPAYICCMQQQQQQQQLQPSPRAAATTSSASPPARASEAPMALVRRSYAPPVVQQPVLLNMTQVTNKQVITRSTGKNLGTVTDMWVDTSRMEVVSLDLEVKKAVGSVKMGTLPLTSLKQIGDVVLVQDERALYEQQLDGRFGFQKLLGMEVRTYSGYSFGKVRDFTFSPDSGQLDRIIYDEFGLGFLPVTFFDCWSLPVNMIQQVSENCIIMADAAKSVSKSETSGVMSMIPALLKAFASSGGGAGAAYSLPAGRSGAFAFLPGNYNYEQWQADVRRWEQETGQSYSEYTAQQQQQQMLQQQRPAARPAMLPAAATTFVPRPDARYQQAPQPAQYQPPAPPAVPNQGMRDARFRGMAPAAARPGPRDPMMDPGRPGASPPMDSRMRSNGQPPASGMPPRRQTAPVNPARPSARGPMRPSQGPAAAPVAGALRPGPVRRVDDWLARDGGAQPQPEYLYEPALQGQEGTGWDGYNRNGGQPQLLAREQERESAQRQ